jgi:hypothetical protein
VWSASLIKLADRPGMPNVKARVQPVGCDPRGSSPNGCGSTRNGSPTPPFRGEFIISSVDASFFGYNIESFLKNSPNVKALFG